MRKGCTTTFRVCGHWDGWPSALKCPLLMWALQEFGSDSVEEAEMRGQTLESHTHIRSLAS